MQSEDALEALFALQSAGVGLLDAELRYIRVNETLARINGRSPAEHQGRPLRDVLLPHIVPIIVPVLERVVAEGRAVLGHRVEGARVQTLADYLPVRDGSGALTGVLVVVIVTTEQRRAETALAVRLRAAELLSELSARFVEAPATSVESAIDDALGIIGTAFALDRTFVGLYDVDRGTIVVAHEWLAHGALSARAAVRHFVLGEARFSTSRLSAGDGVVLRSLADLPEDAVVERKLLEAVGSRAVVLLPLILAGQLIGVAGYTQVTRDRDWQEQELDTLRLVTEIIANALSRKRQDEALRDRLHFEQLTTAISTRLISTPVDELDDALVEALGAMARAVDFDRAAILIGSGADDRRVVGQWHAPGVAPLDSVLEAAERRVPWPSSLTAGQPLIARPDDLPFPRAVSRRLSEDGRMRLNVAVPIRLAGYTVGLVLLQSQRDPQRPDGEIAARAQLFTDMVANAWSRREGEQERQRAFDELHRLKQSIELERDYLREQVLADHGKGEILGNSSSLRLALDEIDAVAGTTAPVLLEGESGVGKELFARALHERSTRAHGPMVKVNCASIPRELFESEFFGHVRGAFTGAHKDRVGRFELANGGTLFLDEVGEIPLELQAKLLRVLQGGELERVGDDRTRKVDVRVVAATNRNLKKEVQAGRFRQDLYYRLAAFPIVIPPLRERGDDVVILADHCLKQSMRAFGRSGLALDEEQKRRLRAYKWPGNVRELQHVIERAVILSRTGPLRLDLGDAASTSREPAGIPTQAASDILTNDQLQELERNNLVAALERAGGRVGGPGGAAEILGLHPSTLRDRMRALGIDRKRG